MSKRRCSRWIALSLFCACMTLGLTAAIPALETSDSANGKFRVIIEASPDSAKDLIASMLRRDGDSDVVHWMTRIPAFRVPGGIAPPTFVSDRGDFFVRVSGFNDVTLYRKGPHSKLVRRASGFQPFVNSQLPAVEDVRGEEVLRLWNGEYNRWDAFKTSDASAFRATADDIARWNESTRLDIIEKLYAAKRKALRRKAIKISAPIARLAGRGMTNHALPTQTDYEFLATVRNPDDRKWIEAMIDRAEPPNGMVNVQRPPRRHDAYYFTLAEHRRAQADWLLGYWDRKVTAPRFHWQHIHDVPRFSLGKVKTTVRLPMPMPIYRHATQATLLHLRLILAEDLDKRADHVREERLAGAIGFERARDRRVVYDANFAFTTVLPGAYRLKAIWDKRSPLSHTNNAGPGDYESALSAPLIVTPGGIISNIVLYCTNRIAGGETYYAADAAFAAQWVADNPPAPTYNSPAE